MIIGARLKFFMGQDIKVELVVTILRNTTRYMKLIMVHTENMLDGRVKKSLVDSLTNLLKRSKHD